MYIVFFSMGGNLIACNWWYIKKEKWKKKKY